MNRFLQQYGYLRGWASHREVWSSTERLDLSQRYSESHREAWVLTERPGHLTERPGHLTDRPWPIKKGFASKRCSPIPALSDSLGSTMNCFSLFFSKVKNPALRDYTSTTCMKYIPKFTIPYSVLINLNSIH